MISIGNNQLTDSAAASALPGASVRGLQPRRGSPIEKTELGQAICGVAYLEGEFRLRSGRTATHYFDKYQFESDPALLRGIADGLTALVPLETDVLAGLELGGIPIATALSLTTSLPLVLVRKAAKEYGTRKLAEGPDIVGRRVLIVEDVVTSGGQVIASARDLMDRGAKVTDAVCVIDREEGGQAALAEVGVRLSALFTRTELSAWLSG